MQQRVIRATVAATVALLALLAGCRDRGPVAVIRGGASTVEVSLEVAATPAERERGLMYRSSLAEGRGMLFVFDADRNHSFWMKNTLIPLDMLFIARDGTVVGIHANATPLSTADIAVGKPSRYVLEVPGGWAARHGIDEGARVEFRGVGALGDGA
jgi:uncharacterized membrane protein (UPF0127 family)